jgi:Mce-associated membrane protein
MTMRARPEGGKGMAERTRRDLTDTGRRRPVVAGERARARRVGRDEAAAGTPAAPVGRAAATAVLSRAAPAPARAAVPSPPRSRRRTVLLVTLLCLAVGLAATAGLFAYRAREAGRADAARTAALAAAQAHAVDILSYDYRTLDRDFARARKAITGPFGNDYAATTGKVVRPTAEQYKAVVKAEVAAASVVTAGPDRATVLLFVNQTTTSTRLDGPKVDLNRVRMTLVPRDGEWLVSDIDAL